MDVKQFALITLLACGLPALAEPLPALVVPKANRTPRLDASPNDPAWRSAAFIPKLTPSLVIGQKPAKPLPTQVMALWDDNFLYVRFVCEDSAIYSPYQGRDAPYYRGDVAEIFLDVVGDGQHYYEIQLAPRGGIFDQYIALTAKPRSDNYGRLVPQVIERDFWPNQSWNCEGLRTATRLLHRNGRDNGWIAEMALPAKTVLQRLGKDRFAPQTLRANFMRYDWQTRPHQKERELVALNWSEVVRGCPHISPARMGLLRLANPTRTFNKN